MFAPPPGPPCVRPLSHICCLFRLWYKKFRSMTFLPIDQWTFLHIVRLHRLYIQLQITLKEAYISTKSLPPLQSLHLCRAWSMWHLKVGQILFVVSFLVSKKTQKFRFGSFFWTEWCKIHLIYLSTTPLKHTSKLPTSNNMSRNQNVLRLAGAILGNINIYYLHYKVVILLK